MKYIIQKGYRGFGDRLTHLIFCVKIALETNRKIYVDWNDHYWNHNGENFSTYFELLNIGINDNTILQGLSVSPSFWKNKLDVSLSRSNYKEAKKFNSLRPFSTIIKKYPTEDVLVAVNHFHKIYTDMSFFFKIFRVKDRRIIDRVTELQKLHNLKDCVGIHLRGTDRKSSTKQNNKNILENITRKIKPQDKLVCFTDDVQLFNDFNKIFPRAILITNIVLDQPVASHTVLPQNLKHSKDEMNVDLLIDFFALASCKKQYSTFNESTFYQMSEKIHPYVDTVLGNGK
jgi:hypothetical protein